MIFKQMFTVTVAIAITEIEKMVTTPKQVSHFFALNSLAPGSHCLSLLILPL